MGRGGILGLIGVCVVFAGTIAFVASATNGRQPIEFNHKKHKDNGVECKVCHQLFEDHSSAGKPDIGTCAVCHQSTLGQSQSEQKLQEYIKSGKEIQWRRIYRVNENFSFSHQRHVVSGKIACESCHGEIGDTTSPPSRPLVKIQMSKCMDCHKKSGVSTDCIVCHR
jgi:hypothetical protein